MSTSRLEGVIVPLVTPVTATGDFDEAAASRLVEHLASNRCGMLVLGTTGEVASLPAALRQRYVEIAVQVARGRVPVFACIAHNVLADAIGLARAHLAAGVDGVVGMLPNYFKLDAPEMEAYFTRLASEIPGSLLLYNMPQTTGMSLPIDVIERLSRIPNITGLKDSENNLGRAELVAQRFRGRDDFSLFMGVAANSVAALKLGFDGIVPSSGNLVPALWRQLFDAARSGDEATAEALQKKLDALSAIFQRNRSLGASLAALKASLSMRGLCSPNMLPPLHPLDAPGMDTLVHELATFS
ncbi:MAG TPA: dihydrodipicolinate synthase family protein [Opitutaceae bacterium]|nr:dihydrodipicolinate synthase family protein [Opitutaceae bacterium]